MYDRIVAADTDHTGTISVRNLFDFIRSMSNEVREAATGGIPIASLNPDTDGDGKMEKWEVDVFERIKEADADKSGSINVKEARRVPRPSLPPEANRPEQTRNRPGTIPTKLIVIDPE